MGLCCTQWPYVADGPARVPRASTKRECVLIVYKHIEKTAGTTLVQWFHELARRGDLTYHSRYFHATGQCATCRSRGNGTANWTPECRCNFASQKHYVMEQFEKRVLHGDRRPFWTFLNDSTPRPWRAVLEFHGTDADLQQFLHRAVRLRAETRGGCSVRATTVWRHPIAHWTSRYNFYVHNGWMHRRKGEPLPPLLEWVRENPNDQTHDLLRGALRNFNHRIRNNDTLLHWQAMRTLRHFDLLFPIERLAQLARALCDALGVDVAACPSVGYANVGKRKRSTPDGPSLEEWTNLTRRYGAVDARLHRHAEESAKQLIDGAL